MNTKTSNKTSVTKGTLDFIRTNRKSTTYVLTDLNKIGDQAAKFKSLLPEVELFYALKCNNADEIVRFLKNKVSGYDVASVGEINKLLKNGVLAKSMVFSNPVKS